MTAPSWRSFPQPQVADSGGPFLTWDVIDAAGVIHDVACAGDGAIATFIGVVRDNDKGQRVRGLEYEAHESMAELEIARLVAEARRRWPITNVRVRHRLGSLLVREVSIVIVISAAHRAPALESCRWLIDTLKAKVPIFKKELYEDGAEWVED